MDVLLTFINETKKNIEELKNYNESETKQAFILRILEFLGWNIYNVNEVKPELGLGNIKVDYSLIIKSKNKVFIEVKKPTEELENHQDQLLQYSFKTGVALAVLTNGISWWFYLPLRGGDWTERKFFVIDFDRQTPEHIAGKFESLLSKENVESDIALQNAEEIIKNKEKVENIRQSINKVWERILTEPSSQLVELLSDEIEKESGYRPEEQFIKEYLKNKIEELPPEPPPTKPKPAPSIKAEKKHLAAKKIELNKEGIFSFLSLILKTSVYARHFFEALTEEDGKILHSEMRKEMKKRYVKFHEKGLGGLMGALNKSYSNVREIVRSEIDFSTGEDYWILDGKILNYFKEYFRR